MQRNPARVSVVVRSIGRATLAPALHSIAFQNHPAIEVVLVAATGASHPPVTRACGPFPVREVRLDRRLSRAEAADAGMRAASGEWITFLDDDDEMLAGHVAGLVGGAADTSDVRAVSGRALATFRDGRTEIWGQRFSRAELFQRNFVHLSTLLFHRSLLEQGIAFEGNLPMHEDWDLALQIAERTRFADHAQPTFRWNADAGSSGAGGGPNADDAAFARHRDYVYAKWRTSAEALAHRCGALLEQAVALAGAGRMPDAVAAVDNVLAVSQNDPHALNLLAMIAMRQGDASAALRHQSLAVEVRPHDPDLRYNLALLRLATGDREGARATLVELLRRAPGHPRAGAKLREVGDRLT